MHINHITFSVLLGGLLAASSAIAGDTVSITQNNAINIRAHVNMNRNDTTNYQVDQRGLFNSYGSASVSNNSVTTLSQSGRQNNALIGQLGNNQTLIINQIQNGRGFSGRTGRMSRR